MVQKKDHLTKFIDIVQDVVDMLSLGRGVVNEVQSMAKDKEATKKVITNEAEDRVNRIRALRATQLTRLPKNDEHND